MIEKIFEQVTCLGCGCGCDDITVTVRDGRIVDTSPACPLGTAWFGDGSVPWEILLAGQPAGLEEALAEAAGILVRFRERVLVYIAPDLTSQAQRAAATLADLLRATMDTATSETAAGGLLAGQRRGRATATLGEVRNRGDVLLFWGVDPAKHYPRFHARYVDPSGIQVPAGRAGRFVIAVNIGTDKGPHGADLTITLEPDEEIAALTLMRAAILGRVSAEIPAPFDRMAAIVPRLVGARYAVLLHDAESTDLPRNPLRAEGLIALAQALNGSTRAALSSLRAGGNRVGSDAVLTWQTGYPFSVDCSRGFPRYVPEQRGLDRVIAGGFSAALVVGSPVVNKAASSALSRLQTVAIGPRVSQASFTTRVAIDTGVAGIHEEGTGYRMDEVPLSLRPPLVSRRSAFECLVALADRVRERARRPA